MLTLAELVDYYKRGLIELSIDLWGLGDLDFSLSWEQVRMLAEGNLEVKREVGGECVIIKIPEEGTLAITVERGHRNDRRANRSQWEKIKRQMREAGFSYRSLSPWFHTYKGGKWSDPLP